MIVGVHADPINHRIPGGVGVYVKRLVEHLLKLEDASSLRLITAKPPPAELAEWWKPGARPSNLPLKVLYSSWNYLRRPLVRAGLDVVHATGLVLPPARDARLVATVHDLCVELMPEVVPGPWRQIYRRGLRRALAESEVILTVTQAIKDELVNHFSIDAARITVTPEAPNQTPADYRDEQWLARKGLQGPFVLTVGTVEPRKNQAMLIEAFAAAGTRLGDYRLVIAGAAGWGAAHVINQIEQSGLQGRVVVTGAVGASELAALYSAARVFALPSLYEGFGLPLIEAMGFGIPSAASTDPALREVGGSAAAFVDPKDVDGWAEALVNLAVDESLRSKSAADGLEQAAQFSWAETARLTWAAYEEAAA